jgi:uncharacterized protein (DUF305 family)
MREGSWSRPVLFALMVGVAAAAACRTAGPAEPPLVQPGAPGSAARPIGVSAATDLSQVRHTQADVRFMQGMIGHHAQALEMTALLPSRSRSDDLRLLALRIEVSQADEIGMMRKWLETRGEAVPDEHAHHARGAPLMPGMLTPEEMDRLAAASGEAFDRLFLASMIKHHEGALIMVEQLFASSGAGQDDEIFAFSSDVDADQRMEIERMSAMLKERQK